MTPRSGPSRAASAPARAAGRSTPWSRAADRRGRARQAAGRAKAGGARPRRRPSRPGRSRPPGGRARSDRPPRAPRRAGAGRPRPAPAVGRCRHPCRLDGHVVAIVESQHGSAGMGAGEASRRGHADDVVRRRRVLHPQRDAQVRVGPDLVAHRRRRAAASPAPGAPRGCGPGWAMSTSDRSEVGQLARRAWRTRRSRRRGAGAPTPAGRGTAAMSSAPALAQQPLPAAAARPRGCGAPARRGGRRDR